MKHIHMCGPLKKALWAIDSALAGTSKLQWFSDFSRSPGNSLQRESQGCVHR